MDITRLAQSGIDYYEGVNRFAGQEKLYEEYLLRFTSDTALTKLMAALKAHDADEAFQQAHNLYGTLGNLSINMLLKELKPIVEKLRLQTLDDVSYKANEFAKLYIQVINTIHEARQGS